MSELILLEPLAADHALELLAVLAGRDRIAAEPEAARQVAKYCDHLPLALRIAGARLRTRPGWLVSDLADRLRDGRQRLSELRAGDRSVRVSFALSYRDLTPALAKAFCLLGQAPGLDFGLQATAAALGGDIRAAESALEMLVDLALLESSVAGRYRFHDLLRVSEVAYAIGAWDIVKGIVNPLRHLLTLRGRTSAQERLLTLATTAAAMAGDPRAQVHYSVLLAEQLMNSHRVNQTPPLYERALELSTQVAEDPAVRLWVLTHYGDALRRLGEPAAASLRYGEAFAIAALGGDMARQAWVLTHWGGAQRDLDRPEVAVAMLSRALDVGRARGDLGNVAWVLTHLAPVLQDLSRFDDADAALAQALSIMQDNDDLVGQEFVLNNMGELLQRRSQPDGAVEAYRQASRVAELRGDAPAAIRWNELALSVVSNRSCQQHATHATPSRSPVGFANCPAMTDSGDPCAPERAFCTRPAE